MWQAVGYPAFCLALYLTDVHFTGGLQHVGDASEEKIKCRPIRTREIGGVRLSDELYGNIRSMFHAYYFFSQLLLNDIF